MQSTDQKVLEALQQKRILVVEDDPDLGPRLCRLFERNATLAPVVKRCMEGLKEGGLEALLGGVPPFHLAVVDVRLPRNEIQLGNITVCQKNRDELQKRLIDLPGAGEEEEPEELGKLRHRIQAVDLEIGQSIDPDAGIKMVEQWVKEMRKSNGDNWKPQTAILYLTARVADEIRDRALQAVEHSAWLSKPVTAEKVVNSAAKLIAALPLVGD